MAIYYVATAGDDTTGNGSIGTPYKTIAKAETIAGVGDTILLNGGDTFREQVVASAAGQTLGAYGTGQPILSGADIITGWA